MSKKTIHWGIIGAGKIAAKFAEDLAKVPHCKLAAIASRSLENANNFAAQFKAEKAFGSYEALVQDPHIDAVYIATPHSFHKSHTFLALENRKPVLCEKPFAMNSSEVEDLIALSKANNTLLMEAMWTAFLPHFTYVLQLLKARHFGKLITLEADFGFHPEYDENSRVFKKSVGGGSLLDIGIYPIFTALSALGLPKSIKATANFFPSGADASCDMHFDYGNATAILKSTLTENTACEAVFHCEAGLIKINSRFHEPSSVTLIDHLGITEHKTFVCNALGYNFEIEHFNTLLRHKKTESDVMSFNTSQNLIGLLDAVRAEIGLVY